VSEGRRFLRPFLFIHIWLRRGFITLCFNQVQVAKSDTRLLGAARQARPRVGFEELDMKGAVSNNRNGALVDWEQ
jgi:hypothetical protein